MGAGRRSRFIGDVGRVVLFLGTPIVLGVPLALLGELGNLASTCAGVLVFLVTTYLLFRQSSPEAIRERVAVRQRRVKSDRKVLWWVLVYFWLGVPLIAQLGVVSVGVAAFYMQSPEEYVPGAPKAATVAISAVFVVLAWLMAHVVYAEHYARLYYEDGRGSGLDFPGGQEPDYFDFLYFSVGVGTTFGTTEVGVLTRRMRRAVLKHSVFSFAFNTAIIALAMSTLTG